MLSFIANRFGVLVGCALFAAVLVLSDSFIFKISVTGSGSYLENDVLSVLRSAGVESCSFYRGMDKPLVQSRIMSLPSVTFCSVVKRGSVILVDVQVDEENSSVARHTPLKSDVTGTLRSLVVICGTAEAEVGQRIEAGTTLIGAYTLSDDGASRPCLAVGYAELEVSAHTSYAADADNERNTKAALSSVLLYSSEILSREYAVKTTAEGVVYEIDFTYLYRISVNLE